MKKCILVLLAVFCGVGLADQKPLTGDKIVINDKDSYYVCYRNYQRNNYGTACTTYKSHENRTLLPGPFTSLFSIVSIKDEATKVEKNYYNRAPSGLCYTDKNNQTLILSSVTDNNGKQIFNCENQKN